MYKFLVAILDTNMSTSNLTILPSAFGFQLSGRKHIIHWISDSSLLNKPLTLYVYQAIASEIYLNGKLLKRFGIEQVMLISMFAWVLRFGLFAFGNPTGGLWMIIMSCIVYGMAFDFFNISGSLFVETNTDSKNRSSAQGLFMMMTNGVGAVLGSFTSGWAIDKFFTHDGVRDWHNIWLSFAGYALIIAIAFAVLFKHKHDPEEVAKVSH